MTSVAGDTDIGDDSVSIDTGFVSEHSHHLVRFLSQFIRNYYTCCATDNMLIFFLFCSSNTIVVWRARSVYADA